MTYSLTEEEMEQVRDMVRILERAADAGFICNEREKELFRLAEKVRNWLRN